MTGASTVESIDLLIRHLEVAKQIAGEPTESLTEDDEFTMPDVMCTLIYAVPGTLCPLLYIHVPSVKGE